MGNKVGPKGQVVIEKAIRDALNVGCGWITLQQLAGDHVEIRFLPPEHGQSLRGRFAAYRGRGLVSEQKLREAAEESWTASWPEPARS